MCSSRQVTQRRDLRTLEFAAQSHSRSDVVLVMFSEQEVRLGMSLPVPASGAQGVSGCHPIASAGATSGDGVCQSAQENNPCSSLAAGHTNFSLLPLDPLELPNVM